jgi:hypothetical protein
VSALPDLNSDLHHKGTKAQNYPDKKWCLGVLAAIVLGLSVPGVFDVAGADGKDRALLLLLPTPDEARPWAPDGPAQLAEGQELFAMINGGAELFLRHGFERAAVQSYALGGGRPIQVEIYQMERPDGAAEVFAQRAGPGEPPLPIGDAGVSGEYYIVFRQGRFLVTVTAADPDPDAKAAALRLARAVEKRIPTTCP